MEKEKKQQKEKYAVEYDTRDVQVMSVDGALVDIDNEIGKLLFFHEMPRIETKDEPKHYCRKKCSVELRMSATQLMKIAQMMAIQVLRLEPEKQHSSKTPPQTMFA